MRAKTAGDPPREQHATRSPSAGAARRRWAARIKRVWQVDPLRCPRCGLADEPPRAPPPGLGELQYVSDLEFVHDPGPADSVWSAD